MRLAPGDDELGRVRGGADADPQPRLRPGPGPVSHAPRRIQVGQREEDGVEAAFGVVVGLQEILRAEPARAKDRVGRPRRGVQPQLAPPAAEVGAREHGQREDLDVVLQVVLGNPVDAAHEPGQVVPGQPQDQVDAGGDPARLQPLRPREHLREPGRAPHEAQRPGVGGLEADLEPVEAGRGKPVGQVVVDRLGPDLAEEADGPTGVQACDLGQQPLEPGAHVQAGVQQIHLPDTAFHRPGHRPQHLLLLGEKQAWPGLVVEAEPAAVRAAALGFEEHDVLELGFEQPTEVWAFGGPEGIGPGTRPHAPPLPGGRSAEQPAENRLPLSEHTAIDGRGAGETIVGSDLRAAEDDARAAALLQPAGHVQAALQVPAEHRKPDHVRLPPAQELEQRRIPQVRGQAFGQDIHLHPRDTPRRKLQAGGAQGDVAGLEAEGVAGDRQLEEKDADHRAVTRERRACRPARSPRRPPRRRRAGRTGRAAGA